MNLCRNIIYIDWFPFGLKAYKIFQISLQNLIENKFDKIKLNLITNWKNVETVQG